MSYDNFDAIGDNLTGTYSGTEQLPLTIMAWVKKTGAQWGDTQFKFIMHFGDDFTDRFNSVALITGGIADQVDCTTYDGSTFGSAVHNFTTDADDDIWVPVVGVITGIADRDVFIEDTSNTQNNTDSRDPGTAFDSIMVGTRLDDPTNTYFEGKIAEVAIFDRVLSAEEINEFQTSVGGGPPPNSIAPESCVGYWPLAIDQTTHPDKSGNGGPNLAENGTVAFNADHPNIAPAATFPVIEDSVAQEFATATDPILVNMPAIVRRGEKLFMFLTVDATGSLPVTPTGWTEEQKANFATSNYVHYSKTAIGNESGTRVLVALSSGARTAASVVYRISNWRDYEYSSVATGTSTVPNPGSLTPSWGTKNTLWLAVAHAGDDGAVASAAPSNFSNLLTARGGSTANEAPSTHTADRANSIDTEDPGTFTLDISEDWAVWTIGIEPAPASIALLKSVEYVSINLTNSNEPLTVNLTKGQDPTQCTPWYSIRTLSSTSDDNRNRNVKVEFIDNGGTPAVKLSQPLNVTADLQVQLFVKEWDPSITVQQVLVTTLNDTVASVNATITDVVEQEAAMFYYSYCVDEAPGDADGDDLADVAVLAHYAGNSTTSITLSRRTNGTDGGLDGILYVISCSNNEFLVEHLAEFEVAHQVENTNQTCTATVLADTFLIHSCEADWANDDMEDAVFQLKLTTSTNINIRRQSDFATGAGDSSGHRIQVVECQDNQFDVQRGDKTMATATETSTITAIDPRRSVLQMGTPYGQLTAGRNESISGSEIETSMTALDFSADDTVRLRQRTATRTDEVVSWEAVQFATLSSKLPSRTGIISVGKINTLQTDLTFSHTTTLDTTVMIVSIGMRADDSADLGDVTFDGVKMDLIKESESSGGGGDAYVTSYGIVGKANVTGNVVVNTDADVAHLAASAVNIKGTATSSVRDAVRGINTTKSDTVKGALTIPNSHGTPGRPLVLVTHWRGFANAPFTYDNGFTKVDLDTAAPLDEVDSSDGAVSGSVLGWAVKLDPPSNGVTVTGSDNEEIATLMFELIPVGEAFDVGVGPTKTTVRLSESGSSHTDTDEAHEMDAGTTLCVVDVITRGIDTDAEDAGFTVVWDTAGVNEALTRVFLDSRAGLDTNDPHFQTWAILNPTIKSALMEFKLSTGSYTNCVVHITNYIGTNTVSLGAALKFVADDFTRGGDSATCDIPIGKTTDKLLHAISAWKGTDTDPLDITTLGWGSIGTNYLPNTTANFATHLAEKPGASAITFDAQGTDPDENNYGYIFEIASPSTQIGHAIAKDEAAHNVNSASFISFDATDAAILGADLEPYSDYLFFYVTGMMGSDQSKVVFQYRIFEDNGIERPNSRAVFEPRQVNTFTAQNYIYMERFQTGSVPNDFIIQGLTDAVSLERINHFYAMAIRLDDLSVKDFEYDDDPTNLTSLSNSAWTDGAQVTVGNGSDDYLILSTAHVIVDSVSAAIRMRVDVGGTPFDFIELEGEDTAEEWCIGMIQYVAAPAASTVIKNQFQTDDASSGLMDVDNNSMFALKLNAFKDHAGIRDGTDTAIDAVDVGKVIATMPHTTSTPADRTWAFLGMAINDVGEDTKQTRRALVDNVLGNIVGGTPGTQTITQIVQNSGTDQTPILLMGEKEFIANATELDVDYVVEEDSDIVPEPSIIDTHIAAFTWELAGLPAEPTFVGSATSLRSNPVGTPSTVIIPTHSLNDLLVIMILTTRNVTPMTAINTPSGWTKEEDVEAGADTAIRLTCFTKLGDGVETFVDITLSGDATHGFAATCAAYNGADATINISGQDEQESGTDMTAPSVTTTVVDTRIVWAYGFDDDISTEADVITDSGFNGVLRGFVETVGGGGDNGGTVGVSDEHQAATGASATCVFSTADDDAGVAITIAIQPVTAPAGGAIQSLLQWSNIGADLFDGALS